MGITPVLAAVSARRGMGEATVFMAFHSTARRKPYLIAASLALLLLGVGVGLFFA